MPQTVAVDDSVELQMHIEYFTSVNQNLERVNNILQIREPKHTEPIYGRKLNKYPIKEPSY